MKIKQFVTSIHNIDEVKHMIHTENARVLGVLYNFISIHPVIDNDILAIDRMHAILSTNEFSWKDSVQCSKKALQW